MIKRYKRNKSEKSPSTSELSLGWWDYVGGDAKVKGAGWQGEPDDQGVQLDHIKANHKQIWSWFVCPRYLVQWNLFQEKSGWRDWSKGKPSFWKFM